MKTDQKKIEQLKSVRAILWDVDGTLFSSQDILAQTYVQAFTDFQEKYDQRLTIPSLEEIMAQIGKPVPEIFQNLASEISPQGRERLSLQVLGHLVQKISFGGGTYYEGVAETLSILRSRNYQFFNASNGRYPYVEAILQRARVIDYFQEIKTLDQKRIRNKTQLVQDILERHKFSPDEFVLIGDRTADRDAACINNIPFIAAAYGHGSPFEWEGAILVIDSLQELSQWLP